MHKISTKMSQPIRVRLIRHRVKQEGWSHSNNCLNSVKCDCVNNREEKVCVATGNCHCETWGLSCRGTASGKEGGKMCRRSSCLKTNPENGGDCANQEHRPPAGQSFLDCMEDSLLQEHLEAQEGFQSGLTH